MADQSPDTHDTAADWRGHVERSLVSHWHRRAESAFRALARVTGIEPASLESLLTAMETGDGGMVRERLAAARFPEDGYKAIVLAAAFDAGAFRVRIVGDGPAVLRRPDGAPFDIDSLVSALTVADAAAVPRLRSLLAEAGIDPDRAGGGTTVPDPGLAVVLGALSHLRLDGRPHDLVVADEGLLFVPCPSSVDKGRERLRRLLTTTDGVAGIARLPGACWLPFEEVATVWILKDTPVKARLTRHDGIEFEFGWTWIGEEIGESSRVLLNRLRALAEPECERPASNRGGCR